MRVSSALVRLWASITPTLCLNHHAVQGGWKTPLTQQYRASGLNLVIAAIVYWNTIYMDDAAQHLRSAAVPVPDDLLVHTSPVGWEHIAFSGDFLWDRAAASAGRKALNLPPDSRAA